MAARHPVRRLGAARPVALLGHGPSPDLPGRHQPVGPAGVRRQLRVPDAAELAAAGVAGSSEVTPRRRPPAQGRLLLVKLLLTSSGISNPSIHAALVELLGKPIADSTALIVPTAILPFSAGPQLAARLIRGEVQTPMTDLGWGSLGVLDLTALPSIDREV